MKNKNSVIIIVAAVIIVIAAAGGYYFGKGSGGAPSNSVYRNNGSAKSVTGDNKAALIGDLEEKLREKPEDAQVMYTLADTYFTMKRFDDAVNYYKKLLILTPENADIYNDLGLSLHYLGRSYEGLTILDDGIKKNPYNQRIWLTKGFVLAYGVGDLTKAGKAWKKARGIDPQSSIGKAADNYLVQIKKTAKSKKQGLK